MDAGQREIKKSWLENERQKLRDSVPMPIFELKGLLEFLEAADFDCDHTDANTVRYLESRKLDVARITAWLRDQGGYCDCEVLANVASECDAILKDE